MAPNATAPDLRHILVYGDSLTWGIIPNTRRRLAFHQRWPGVLEGELARMGGRVRVVEDCLNGRRTVWDDPFKPGRNGLVGLEQRIEVNSPLDLIILMLGTNDFQITHQNTAFMSAQGIAAIVRTIRRAPIEPGMAVPPILIGVPPLTKGAKGEMAGKFAGAEQRCVGLAEEYRKVAAELSCAYFDAGSVVNTSAVDGVHLDAEQHAQLGTAIAPVVMKCLSGRS